MKQSLYGKQPPILQRCPFCTVEMRPNEKYCPHCGKQLTFASQLAGQTAQQPGRQQKQTNNQNSLPEQQPSTNASKSVPVPPPSSGSVSPETTASRPSATQLLGTLVSILQSKASETTKSTPPPLPHWKANLLLYGLMTIVVALLVGSVLSGFGMLPSAIASATSALGGTLAAVLGVLGGLFAGSILQLGMKDIWQQANRPLTTLASILTISVLLMTLFSNADPYLHRGMLALNDPLQDNSSGYAWSVSNDCTFVNRALHVSSEQQNHGINCIAQSTNFSDFVYEVQMTILYGDGGGLVFRQNLTALTPHEYIFRIYSNGSYDLELYTSISQWGNFKPSAIVYKSGPVPSIHAGLNKSNTLAVIATSSGIELWANGHRLVSLSESTYKEGGFIGVDANDITQPTEVAFSNAKVWTLS